MHAATKLVHQFIYSRPSFTIRYHPYTMTAKISALRKDHGRELNSRRQKTDLSWEHTIDMATDPASIDDNSDGNFALTVNARQLSHTIVQDRPFSRAGGLPNPKCEILQMSYNETTGICKVQISEPLLLSTMQHPYAMQGDFQLILQISRNWLKDLLWCSDYSYGCYAGNGGIISPISAANGSYEMGQVYASVKKLEYHATFIQPMVPSIPRSIGIKYSQLTVQTQLLQSLTIDTQFIVPPSCRA